MASTERVRRSIEFQYGVNAEDLIKGTTIAENSIEGLETKLAELQAKFKGTEIGTAEFNRLGKEIQSTQSKLKTLDERFEGLGAEQKATAIAESFNVVVGAVGAVTGALVALGIESEAIENVEKRILGVLTVVTSLREVATGLQSFIKIWPILTANVGKATAAIRAFALANPFTAILTVITAVVGAIALFTSGTKEATEETKKLREEAEKFNAEQDKINQGVKDRARDITLLGKSELGAAKARLAFAQQDLKAAQIANNRIEAELRFAKEQKASSATLLEIKKRELESRRLEEEATAKVIEAEFAYTEAKKKAGEEAKKTAKEERDRRLELEGTRQVILQLSEEIINSILSTPAEPGSILDLRNLQGIETTLAGIKTIVEEIDFEELGDPIKFLTEEQLNVLKRLRGELDTDLQQQLAAREKQYNDELALFANNEEAKKRLAEEYEQDISKIRRKYAIQTAQNIIGVTSQFVNTIAEINQQSLELQLAQAAGNQAAIDRINAEALERQKKLRVAQTLITTAESILNGFNATSTLPPPFNFIAGGVLAAAYAALGAKTIQTINSTTLEGGGSSGGGFNNIPGGGFSLPGGGQSVPITQGGGAALPGLGGGRVAGAPTIGTIGQEPIRAYVLAGDVTNGVQANAALNNRRRLASG